MQQIDPLTRVLIHAGLISVALVTLLVFVRIVQESILVHRETGSLFTWKPDTPAIRRFRRINRLLFGSMRFVVALVWACGAGWYSWFCFQNGNARLGKITAFGVLPALIVMFTSGYTVRKSLQERSTENNEILEAEDVLDEDY